MSSEPLLSFVVSHPKYEDSRHLGTASSGKVTKTINGERKHQELSLIPQEERDSVTSVKQEEDAIKKEHSENAHTKK